MNTTKSTECLSPASIETPPYLPKENNHADESVQAAHAKTSLREPCPLPGNHRFIRMITDAQVRAKKAVSEQEKSGVVHSLRPKPGCDGSTPSNRQWRRRLEREGNDDRDFFVAFLNHWADAFVKNPDAYKGRHPILGQ